MTSSPNKWLFFLPGVIFLAVVGIYPMVYSIQTSFRMVMLGQLGSFIGFQNYVQAFQEPDFIPSLINTGIFLVISIIVETVLGISIALLVFSALRVNAWLPKVFQSFFLLPVFIPGIVTGVVWHLMDNSQFGLIPFILHNRGVGILSQIWPARLAVIGENVWQWTPFISLITLSGLLSVPESLLEAASIDGASKVRSLIYIALPLASKAVLVAILLRILRLISIFSSINTLTNMGPGISTESITGAIFTSTFNDLNTGVGAAESWMLAVLVGIVVSIFLRYTPIFEMKTRTLSSPTRRKTRLFPHRKSTALGGSHVDEI